MQETSPTLTLSERLAQPEELDRLCELIETTGEIGHAARAYGVTHRHLNYIAARMPRLRQAMDVAKQIIAEERIDEARAIADSATPETVRVCELRIKQRQWEAEKLLRLIYGAQPTNNVNITNNTAIVCDETERARLIALRERLVGGASARPLLPDVPTTDEEEDEYL